MSLRFEDGFDVVLYLTLPATGAMEVWRALHGRGLSQRGLIGASLVDEDELGPADAQQLRPNADAAVVAALRAREASRARVVLDIRRQDRLMEHAHLHALREGASAPFGERFGQPDLPVLDWGELAERIAAVPGVAEVVLRPVEAFAERPEALAADLLRLAGVHDVAPAEVERPPTYSARGVWVAGALNAHLCSDAERVLVRDFVATNFPGPSAGNQFLREDIRTRIVTAHGPVNRKLFRTWLPELPEDAYLDDDRTAALGHWPDRSTRTAEDLTS